MGARNCQGYDSPQKLVLNGLRFSWDESVHGKELDVIRGQMKNLLPFSPFDLSLESHVYNYASLLGFGYCLLQLHQDGGWNILCCGSTGIKPNQNRWKPYDLELTAIVYVCQKLHYYISY